MPTQAQLQEANRLRTTNPNLSIPDSVSQVLRGPTSTAPTPTGGSTLPIAPTVTPESIAPLAPTPQPVANAGDTVLGVNGEKFTQANNQDMTTTPVAPPKVVDQSSVQPVTPSVTPTLTPVASVTPTPVKPVDKPIVDYNSSAGREGDVNNHLNTAYASGITTDNGIKAYSGYETASPDKKAMIDTFIQSKQPTTGSIYSQLATGQEVSPTLYNTPAYKMANIQYSKAKQFSTLTPGQLVDSMKNGEIVEGSENWEKVKTMNPKLTTDASNLRKVNKVQTQIVKTETLPNGTVTKTNTLETNASQDIMSAYSELFRVESIDEINKRLATPDFLAEKAKADGILVERDNLISQKKKISADVDAELAGTGATGSRIALEKAFRNEKLDSQIDGLERSYTLSFNKYNAITTQNMQAYNIQKDQKTALQNVAMKSLDQKITQQNAEFSANLDLQKTAYTAKLQQFQSLTKFEQDKQMETFKADLQAKTKGEEWQSANITKYNPATGANESYPVFYRKKTQGGGFEAVDISGNKVDPSNLAGNPAGTPTGLTTLAGSTDMRSLADKYPGNASFKNNNPSGITWEAASAGLKKAWTDAGVQFQQGTARPANEGGSYVGFASAEDGIKAKMVAITRGYAQASVNEFLDKWGTGSANIKVGFDKNLKVGDLSETQFNELIKKQMAWESPNFLKEYETMKGSTTTGAGINTAEDKSPQYREYLNKGSLPAGMKAGTLKSQEFLSEYTKWKTANNPISESVQKRVDSYSDDYSKNANVVSAFKFAPLMRAYTGVKVSDLSSSQRQAIISDYAKALDPDSVVREGEYATVAKYSSSWGEKTLSEIRQAVTGNGTLSDEAAQKVIDAIISRGKNYTEQEKNIRQQYSTKINKATGNQDGETQLIYPDYQTDSNSVASYSIVTPTPVAPPPVSGSKSYKTSSGSFILPTR